MNVPKWSLRRRVTTIIRLSRWDRAGTTRGRSENSLVHTLSRRLLMRYMNTRIIKGMWGSLPRDITTFNLRSRETFKFGKAWIVALVRIVMEVNITDRMEIPPPKTVQATINGLTRNLRTPQSAVKAPSTSPLITINSSSISSSSSSSILSITTWHPLSEEMECVTLLLPLHLDMTTERPPLANLIWRTKTSYEKRNHSARSANAVKLLRILRLMRGSQKGARYPRQWAQSTKTATEEERNPKMLMMTQLTFK